VTRPTLLAVPNVSEGRELALIDQLGQAFALPPARLLDVHSDPDHNRSVFTLAGGPAALAPALLEGASAAVAAIDLGAHEGAHPCVGALDVAPIVYLEPGDLGAACAEALVLADLLAERLELPVFLYGALAGGRTRAELRAGGRSRLAERIAAGELTPDFGPHRLHPTAGAVLVAARPPLIAFNVELAPPATLADAERIAAAIREGAPEGVPGLRAIGVWLEDRNIAQVSMNIEDHDRSPLMDVIAAIARDAEVAGTELVGLAPAAALAGFPQDVPLSGRATIEETLEAAS
jgi:glutamate formiminotransferase